MDKQIWKFKLPFDSTKIDMPFGADILTVQVQNEQAYIWAMVNPLNSLKPRYFQTFSTGENIKSNADNKNQYIGTYQLEDGLFVYHVFERIN